MGAAAAAVIVAREKDIVEAFRQAGATRPDAAATPESLGVSRRLAFRILVNDAVVRETQPGFFYLDELSWQAKCSIRRRVALVVLVLVAIVLIGVGAATVLLRGLDSMVH